MNLSLGPPMDRPPLLSLYPPSIRHTANYRQQLAIQGTQPAHIAYYSLKLLGTDRWTADHLELGDRVE